MATSRLACPAVDELGTPALYLHDITGSPAARKLLQLKPYLHPESNNVIPRLSLLTPVIADVFGPRTDDHEHFPFRLLTTRPIWNSDEVHSYVAISYCWRTPEWDLAPGLLEEDRYSVTTDWTLPISPLMLKTILQRCMYGAALWIDQLCIDQADHSEKSRAIANMDCIFRNAESVHIVLEDVTIAPEVGIILDQVIQDYYQNDPTADEPEYQSLDRGAGFTMRNFDVAMKYANEGQLIILRDSLRRMFTARWFRRAWCMQEWLLNPRREFFIPTASSGILSMRCRVFLKLAQIGADNPEDDREDTGFHSLVLSHIQGLEFDCWKPLRRVSMHALFREIAECECLVASDKLSIALNVAGVPLIVLVETKSSAMIDWMLAGLALALGDATCLGIPGPYLQHSAQNNRLLWLARVSDVRSDRSVEHSDQRWTSSIYYGRTQFASEAIQQIADPHGIHKIEPQTIRLDMMLINHDFLIEDQSYDLSVSSKREGVPMKSTESTSPGLITDSQVSQAVCDFYQAYELECRNMRRDIANSRGYAYGDSSNYVMTPLAQRIMTRLTNHGLAWVVPGYQALGDTAQRYIKECQAVYLQRNVDPRPLALRYLYRSKENDRNHRDYLDCDKLLTVLLFCLMIQRFLPSDGDYVVQPYEPSPTSQLGLLFLTRKDLTALQDPKRNIILTVPTAVNSSSATGVPRLWLLEETVPGQYAHVGMGYLFFVHEVHDTCSGVRLMRDVLVQGPELSTFMDGSAQTSRA